MAPPTFGLMQSRKRRGHRRSQASTSKSSDACTWGEEGVGAEAEKES